IFLKQGSPDPLALMTFKILPGSHTEDKAFAARPVGSGPYTYGGLTTTEDGRQCAVFKANPTYGRRPDRHNLPRIKEIHLLKSSDPVADFNYGRAHLVLTTRTSDIAKLGPSQKSGGNTAGQGKLDIVLEGGKNVPSLASRRVYFLAINHLRPELGGTRGQ